MIFFPLNNRHRPPSESEMVEKTILDNGIQVITEEIPGVHSVSLGVWVQAGSRDENPEECGISHFIEHMLFKGTKRRSPQQIAKEIDAVGGVLNAFTSKEFSSFYAKVLTEHLPVALDLLFDLFLNSQFAAEELEKERQVIVQEISMIEDTPDEYIHDLFSEAFWAGHPLSYPILGRLDTIGRMNRRQLKDFFVHHYLSVEPILVAAGNLTHEKFLKPVEKALGKIRPRPKRRKKQPPRPHPNLLVKNKKLEQVHLLLGTQGLAAVHAQRYAVSILNTVFGGGMSSRLFQEIREKRGLAYSVYSFLSSFADSGMLGVYVGTGEKTLNRVLQIILREMHRLSEVYLKPQELRAAKEQLKGNLLLSLESTDSRMGRLAKNEIYFQRFIETPEIIEGIEKVTAAEVCQLAQQLFKPQFLSLTALGPVTEKEIPKGVVQA